jgi:hypothetical protein
MILSMKTRRMISTYLVETISIFVKNIRPIGIHKPNKKIEMLKKKQIRVKFPHL